jgi:hypothetical protein
MILFLQPFFTVQLQLWPGEMRDKISHIPETVLKGSPSTFLKKKLHLVAFLKEPIAS